MTAAEIIALRAPQYASEARLDNLIVLAEAQTSESYFGERRSEAVALRVLHWLTLEGRDGMGGAIMNEKIGDLSRTHLSVAGELNQTSWGIELQSLISQSGCGLRTRMG